MFSTSRTNKHRAAGALAFVAVILIFGAGVAVSSASVPQKAAALNPDDGLLTDTEKIAAHNANTAAFWTHYEKWLAELDPAKDLRSYPREELLVSSRPGASSLFDATSTAQQIVFGEVESVDFQTGPIALVHVHIDETLKGDLESTVTVVIPCMVTPSVDWTVASIACAEAVPMLYPNDQVILLLERNGDDKPYSIQPWTGLYWVQGESLKTVDGNAFGLTIEMLTPKQLMEAMRGKA